MSLSDHKLIRLFSLFDKAQVNRFRQFLQSPYHLRLKKVADLGEQLLNFYPNFDHASFTEEAIYRSTFPEEHFDKKNLTRYLSRLSAIVDQFAAFEVFTSQSVRVSDAAEEFYYMMQFEPWFEKKQKARQKLLEADQPVDSQHYFYHYLSQKRRHNYLIQQANPQGARDAFQTATTSLDMYYTIEILQAATNLISQHRLGAHDLENMFYLKAVLCAIEEDESRFSLLARLWFYAYKLVIDPNSENSYQDLKNILETQSAYIPKRDARNFTVLLQRSLKVKKHISRLDYLKELHGIFKLEIKEGWLLTQETIHYSDFNNIVTLGLALGLTDWTQQFIQDYEPYLLHKMHQDISNFNRAKLAFAVGKYREALKHLRTIKNLNTRITLEIKRLQIKCFYELNEYAHIINQENAFRVYLHRMSDSLSDLKDRNLTFLKLVKVMCSLTEQSLPQNSLQKIEEIMQEHPLTPDLEWVRSSMSARL